MKLIRTHTPSLTELVEDGLRTLTEVEKRVAWCASDNLDASHQVAGQLAQRAVHELKCGRPYLLGPYRFELVLEAKGVR